jgi:hypothetical protein
MRMSDIVDRLRWRAVNTSTPTATTPMLCAEAADTITTLRAENEKLRAALHEAAVELDACYRAAYPGDHPYSKERLADAMRDNPARAAIAVALEEAARVIGEMPRTHTTVKMCDVMGMKAEVTLTLNNGPAECAAAIRAMIPKEKQDADKA